MLMNLWSDLKYAWRLMLKTPGYTLLCATVVALSVGLAIWTYAMVYTLTLKKLPFPGSEHWLSVQVAPDATTAANPDLDAYTYQELLQRNRTVHYIGAFSPRAAVLSEGQASISLRAVAIDPQLLAALRAAPQVGRLFETADTRPDAPATAILSFDTWHSYFAADPAVIGRQTRIDGQAVQIIGVLPEGLFAFQDFQLWLPLQPARLPQPSAAAKTISPFIVLDGNQSRNSVLNEIGVTLADLQRNFPQTYKAGRHAELFPAHLMYNHNNLPLVSMVCLVAVAVLLLGCMNIGLVFLARLLERSREMAVRISVGSSFSRLLRQALLETVFVVIHGAVVGSILAALGLNWAQGVGDYHVRLEALGRQANQLEMHTVDLLAAVAAATVVWLSSTLIPAWRVAKMDAALVLAGSGKNVAGTGRNRVATILVGVEVLMSALLLVICANVVFAVHQRAAKPSGLQTASVTISTYPTVFEARYSQPAQRLGYWDSLATAIGSRIGGAAVAYATATPTRPDSVPATIEGRQGEHQGSFTLPLTTVSQNYFETLGVHLKRGRLFETTDNSSSQPVAIVDESSARLYWPGQEVIGKRLRFGEGPWLTIVGVVSHVAGRPYSDDAVGLVYQALRQVTPGTFQLLVRTPATAGDSRATLRAAAYSVDRDLPLHNLQPLDEYMDALNLDYKSLVPVFSVIAVITVILASTGLFGLVSRSVARRTQEIGVRRALGGTSWHVAGVFLRQGALYLGIGLVGGAFGILVTSVMSQAIPNLLSAAVPVTFGVLMLLTLVVLLSTFLPVRSAVAMEPGDALRYE
jgi:predicted permease